MAREQIHQEDNKVLDKFKILSIILFLFLGIVSILLMNSLNDATIQIAIHKIEISQIKEDHHEQIKEILLSIESQKEHVNKEFLETWKSLGRMTNNFRALGTGMHLEQKDISNEN